MQLTDFDFDLPGDAIAFRPENPRDSARLLHIGDTLTDRHVFDLPCVLQAGDLLILNDTKVIPVQLFGLRGTTNIEVTLMKRLGSSQWQAMAKPGRKLAVGDDIMFPSTCTATVAAKNPDGGLVLVFNKDDAGMAAYLALHGSMPLPPYIRKSREVDDKDLEDYQTIFAKHEGAVAAPTAGLHFTQALFHSLAKTGIDWVSVTLHVGAGTFFPIKTDNIHDHKMHAETGDISAQAAMTINRTRKNGGRVIAVGTTVLRLLESACWQDGQILPFTGTTDIFILPGHRFKSADLLITNFHLPKSTLFMLVCAYGGTERMKHAYRYAIENRYRFYSYGDACLIERA